MVEFVEENLESFLMGGICRGKHRSKKVLVSFVSLNNRDIECQNLKEWKLLIIYEIFFHCNFYRESLFLAACKLGEVLRN